MKLIEMCDCVEPGLGRAEVSGEYIAVKSVGVEPIAARNTRAATSTLNMQHATRNTQYAIR